MARIKALVDEDIELETNDTDKNGLYPGEARDNLVDAISREDSEREWELSKFSITELQEEIARRTPFQMNKKLPEKPDWMEQDRYEDLCHLFKENGYNYNRFKKVVDEINKTPGYIIQICKKCGKVDINPLTHYRTCDPVGEQYRQESQEVYWR